MARLFPILYFVLLVLLVPVESVGQESYLTKTLNKLDEVKIVVEIYDDAKELGLNEEDIKNHVFVFLRSKMPSLKVKDSATPYLQVWSTLAFIKVEGRKIGYYGDVKVEVLRLAVVSKSQRPALLIVWNSSILFTGPRGDASTDIKKYLDKLLTKFAADWYRDNP